MLYVMKGLPASSKSTMAREILKEDGNAIRVNKDDLRNMLWGDLEWSGKREKITAKIHDKIIENAVNMGKSVVIDNTNLGKIDKWKTFAAQNNIRLEVVDLSDVSVEECIKRDSKREGKARVGPDVILNMASRYGIWKDERPIAIIDIDGTAMDISKRREMASLPDGSIDWKIFLNPVFARDHDVGRKDVFERIQAAIDDGLAIYFVSGRPESMRVVTIDQLDRYGAAYLNNPGKTLSGYWWDRLIFRPNQDYRPDTELKQWFLDNYINKDNVAFAIDDRPCILNMWKANGIQTIDVGNGVEF